MSKLNWERGRFRGRPTLDFRSESKRDAADRWLSRAESQQAQWRRPRGERRQTPILRGDDRPVVSSPINTYGKFNCGGAVVSVYFPAKRRREIERHARHIGVMDTDYPDHHLIAWQWHNSSSTDQAWSLMEATKRMGRRISKEKADSIIEQAASIPERRTADSLGKFIKLKYADRDALGITTIGSFDVLKRARKELRKRKARIRMEIARRTAGMKPQSESLSATEPWKAEGISRRTWERRRKKTLTQLTQLCAQPSYLLKAANKTVSAGLCVLPHGAGYASAIVTITEIKASPVSSSSRKATLIRANIAVPRRRPDRFRDQYLKQQASQRVSAEATLEQYRLAANGGGQ